MKRLIIISLCAVVVTFSSLSVATGQENTAITVDKTQNGRTLTNLIDGFNVPQEILETAQVVYPGHAVTKAEKITRDGKEMYRLRVDRDDDISDYESILLLFDMEWKFIADEKLVAPPRKVAKPKDESSLADTPASGSENDREDTIATPTSSSEDNEEKKPEVLETPPAPLDGTDVGDEEQTE